MSDRAQTNQPRPYYGLYGCDTQGSAILQAVSATEWPLRGVTDNLVSDFLQPASESSSVPSTIAHF